MNDTKNLFTKQKCISPPDSLADDVEQVVMSRVRKSKPAPILYQRKFITGALGIVAVIVLIGTLVQRDVSTTIPPKKNIAFVESTIILDNHVAIWLEPIDAQEKQR